MGSFAFAQDDNTELARVAEEAPRFRVTDVTAQSKSTAHASTT